MGVEWCDIPVINWFLSCDETPSTHDNTTTSSVHTNGTADADGGVCTAPEGFLADAGGPPHSTLTCEAPDNGSSVDDNGGSSFGNVLASTVLLGGVIVAGSSGNGNGEGRNNHTDPTDGFLNSAAEAYDMTEVRPEDLVCLDLDRAFIGGDGATLPSPHTMEDSNHLEAIRTIMRATRLNTFGVEVPVTIRHQALVPLLNQAGINVTASTLQARYPDMQSLLLNLDESTRREVMRRAFAVNDQLNPQLPGANGETLPRVFSEGEIFTIYQELIVANYHQENPGEHALRVLNHEVPRFRELPMEARLSMVEELSNRWARYPHEASSTTLRRRAVQDLVDARRNNGFDLRTRTEINRDRERRRRGI